MRVLVTGATGGLGRNAVEALQKNGFKVRATGRNPKVANLFLAQGVDFVPLDLATATSSQCDALVQGCDAVWHCAALSSPWGSLEAFTAANVTATRSLAQAAARARPRLRFVHISTPALYFNFQHQYNVEEVFVPRRYVNHYAATKAKAELEVLGAQAQGLHVNILRPRAIFGPYDQVLLPRLLALATKRNGNLVLPRAGATVLDLTYVDNVIQAMELATFNEHATSGGVYNITNDAPGTVASVLLPLFHKHLQQPLTLRALPTSMLLGVAKALEGWGAVTGKEPPFTRYSLGALAYDMTLSIEKAKSQLGYQPRVPMKDAIALTGAWLQRQERGSQ